MNKISTILSGCCIWNGSSALIGFTFADLCAKAVEQLQSDTPEYQIV